ncbi:riboflavin synthase [Candidatus Peregrinibacteria bacterium]|nr:riboflavin synthase [Candidatus Peregrinibacteria bacterium]
MFTGIIETTGAVVKNAKGRIEIKAPPMIRRLKKGGSIAVDGACLTVISKTAKTFTADVMPETYKKTVLGQREKGGLVNLELPLKAGGPVEGHWVSGHVEGMAALAKISPDKEATLLTFRAPKELLKYIVPKGSVALNGISLTVIGVTKDGLTVGIIPHTYNLTNLRALDLGDKVNIETDLLARHMEKMLKSLAKK